MQKNQNGGEDRFRSINSTPIPPTDKQLQPTTLGGCTPCEVTHHKYFSFLMDDGRLLFFVIFYLFLLLCQKRRLVERGRGSAGNVDGDGWWRWRWCLVLMAIIYWRWWHCALPTGRAFAFDCGFWRCWRMSYAVPFLYFGCGYCSCSCYWIVVVVVSPLLSGTGSCVPLLSGTVLPAWVVIIPQQWYWWEVCCKTYPRLTSADDGERGTRPEVSVWRQGNYGVWQSTGRIISSTIFGWRLLFFLSSSFYLRLWYVAHVLCHYRILKTISTRPCSLWLSTDSESS